MDVPDDLVTEMACAISRARFEAQRWVDSEPQPGPGPESPAQACARVAVEWVAPPDGATDHRIEIAREFTDPPYPDVPIPWTVEGFGEPDLSQPPPPSGGHPMRWVTRTVTYGPWQPVAADDTRET